MHVMRMMCAAIAAAVMMAVCAAPASAQQVSELRANVVDESGGVIAGAMVEARDASGTVRGRAATDENGAAMIPDLPVGRYTIEVVKELFEVSSTSVNLQSGGAPLRIPLSVGVVRESVSVGAPKVDEKPTGQIVTSIDRSVIKDTTGFSIAEIITFSPGVTVQQANGPRDVLISVRGSNSRSTFGLRNTAGSGLSDDGRDPADRARPGAARLRPHSSRQPLPRPVAPAGLTPPHT